LGVFVPQPMPRLAYPKRIRQGWIIVYLAASLAGVACTDAGRVVVYCDPYSRQMAQPLLDSLADAGAQPKLVVGPGHFLAKKIALGAPCHWLILPDAPIVWLAYRHTYTLADTLIRVYNPAKTPDILCLAEARSPMRHWQDMYREKVWGHSATTCIEIAELNCTDYLGANMIRHTLLPRSMLKNLPAQSEEQPGYPMRHRVFSF
jgi:hypothetical protein